MKTLPRWVRLLLWVCGASVNELLEPYGQVLTQLPVASPALPPPSPELVARAATALEHAKLELQLRRLDGLLGVALGSARLDPFSGHYIRTPNEWRS